MELAKVFRVAVVANLDDREWRVLTAAARLTTARARSYVFEPLSESAPDVYLVDGDDSSMVQTWQSKSVWHPAPAVILKSNPDSSEEKWEFTRTLAPSCLLKLVTLLDKISVQELGFLPELCIGQEEASADSTLAMS